MAVFAGIHSQNPETRRRFIESVSSRLAAGHAGLRPGRHDEGAFSAIWAVPEGLSVSVERRPGGGRIALDLGSLSARADFSEREIRIGSDPLALFPLYHCRTHSDFSFASAPHLLADAPGFAKEIDPVSLAMLLMLGVVPSPRTLLKGLHRSSPFSETVWTAEAGARAVALPSWTASDRHFGDSFERNLERVDELLIKGMDAELGRAGETVFLLSGGLDSRLLAGYADAVTGIRIRALTQGQAADTEVQTAQGVSRELDWPHEIVPENPDAYEALADFKLDHEFLAGGFNLTYFAQLAARLGSRTVVSGAYGDGVLGCAELPDDPTGYDAESHLSECSRPFFVPDALRRAARTAELRRAVDQAHEELRGLYDRLPGTPFQKAWQFDLLAVDRVKVVFPRYLAFGGKPFIPFVDGKLLEAIAGMPPKHLAKRRLERELLIRRFPKLAALAADRNRRAPVPPLGIGRLLRGNTIGAATRARALKTHILSRVSTALQKRKRESGETRFYYRVLDVNGAPWKRLRAKAAAGRTRLADWLDAETLDRWLPDPSADLRLRDGIYHGQKTRLLTGLALWTARTLA